MERTSKKDQTEAFLNSDTVSNEFFISIVENKLKISREDFKLRLVLLFPAAGKNENFTSVIFRAKIKIEHNDGRMESVQAIVKALLEIMPELKEMGVFSRERKMYEGVISSFEKIWEEVGVEVNFGPKSIKFETDPYEILVLDDLAEKGYAIADRKVGVDLKIAKLLLEKLAKFHAASAVRFEIDGYIHPELDRKNLKFPEPPEGEPHPMVNAMQNLLRSLHEAVQGFGVDYAIYADKIGRWDLVKLMTSFMRTSEPMRSGFQILTHGDAWVNNFMIKYDEESNPIDILLIDFQISYWGSPSIELLYFFISSLNDDIKVDHFDELVEFYHIELVNNLKMLNYAKPIPTLGELHIDMIEKGFFASTCIMFVLFVCKFNSDKEISIDQLFTGGEETEALLKIIYSNESYSKACKKWLPFLNRRGFLDSLL